MSFIQVDYCTWEREETYGMFDYSEQKNIKCYNKINIKEPGRLFRNVTSFQLIFSKDLQAKVPVGHQVFLKIEVKQGHFFIINEEGEGEKEPLCAIVSSSEGLRLKQGDKIRLGKAKL